MIGKHCHSEMQDKFLYAVLLVKKSIMKNHSLYFLNLTLCHPYGSKQHISVTGYNVEKKSS